MGHFKNIATEETNQDSFMIVVPDKSPVQQVDKAAIEATVERMRFIVPNGESMSKPQLTVIAQESILYRTVPGRDVHYFINKGQLQRIYDYKYLKNFATFKEQLLSGDKSATLDDKYYALTEEEKIKHNIDPVNIAARCVLTTARERRQFASEVKMWKETGFDINDATKMARETYGLIGTEAVGVVSPNDAVPKGWSHLQYAEKLAFKNAVNRKYGIPTADEMQAMAYRMANRAMPEHWKNVDPSQPIDIQARLADIEAIAAEVAEESKGMTPEEHRQRLDENVLILRDDPEGEFIYSIIDTIGFFETSDSVRDAMRELKIHYSPIEEDDIRVKLARYASNKTDMSQASQPELIAS